MNEAERAASEIARDQYGVISRAQALEAGMAPRTVQRRGASGDWERIFPTVFALPGAPKTGRQLAKAATLWVPDSAISHSTGGRLLRLDGIEADGVHLSTVESELRSHIITIHRTKELAKVDRVTVDGIPCTSATRALIDNAAELSDEALEVAFESARRLRLTSPAALEQRARVLCGSGRAGSSKVWALLGRQTTSERPAEYRLEVRAARMLRASELPRPVRQHVVVINGRRYRLDFAWAHVLVALECDGFDSHGYRLAWKRDRRRLAALEHAGWRVVSATWDDITHRPAETVERLAAALGERGLLL